MQGFSMVAGVRDMCCLWARQGERIPGHAWQHELVVERAADMHGHLVDRGERLVHSHLLHTIEPRSGQS